MNKYLKISPKKALTILAIFGLIFIGNIVLQKHDINQELSNHPCTGPKYDLACLGKNVKGHIVEGLDIGAYYMYLSVVIFVLITLLFFKPKEYTRLTPILIITWIVLSEIFVRIFNIRVITTSLRGKITIFDSLYLGFEHGEIFIIIPFMIVISAISMAIAYPTTLLMRKIFITSDNSN